MWKVTAEELPDINKEVFIQDCSGYIDRGYLQEGAGAEWQEPEEFYWESYAEGCKVHLDEFPLWMDIPEVTDELKHLVEGKP